jgi:hypothetical protein
MALKPVVFIPGFPASELRRKASNRAVYPPSLADLIDADKKKRLVELLSMDPPSADLVAGEPIRRVTAIAKQAESLYDILRQRYGYTIDAGDNFRAIGWDWRFGIDDAAVNNSILNAINTLSAPGPRVVVIIHSTGGLVLRRFLESNPALADRIEKILAFGVPWGGNLKAFRYLTEGDAIGPFFAKMSAAQTRTVMRFAQAAYDLCPPDPARTDLTDESGQPLGLVVDDGGQQIGPMLSTSWVPAGGNADANRLRASMLARASAADQRLGQRTNSIALGGHATPPVTNIVGWGVPTEVRCLLEASGEVTFNPARKNDKPYGDEKDGDGTVALKSAAWLTGAGVRSFFLPIGAYPTAGIPNRHPRIWDSPPVQQIFNEILMDEPAEEFVCAAADGEEALDRSSDVTIRLSAADVSGRPLPNAQATLRLPGGARTIDFAGGVRRDVVVRRTNMLGNAAPNMFRFTIDVTWGANGRRELPVLIRV